MKTTSNHLLLALCLALLAGCSSPDTGSAQFAVSVPQALSSSISRITVTASAADFPSVSVDLVSSSSGWSGFLGNLPAGSNRSFLAQAFDSSGTLLFQGSALGVSILADQTALIAITLQQVNAPPPFDNEAPLIDSLVAASTSVPAGGALSLSAIAHDPNPGDTLSYAWSSTAGTFSSPGAASTSWTAPASTGLQTLTLTVTDSQGLSASISLSITVTSSGGQGNAQVFVYFNTAPLVASLGAAPTQLAVGQTTAVSALASDADGDSLSYAWSASCAGAWANASSSSAQFTPSALPAGACNNCRLTVSVTDGRGGRSTGSVALCVSNSAPATPHSNPVLVSATASSPTASPGQVLTFEVVANDPEGSALSFSWAASTGSLGTASNSASTSLITWTALACVSAGTSPVITVTVTNAFNLTVTNRFAMTGLPVCAAPAWTPTGSMFSLRGGHTATLLPDGKVLVSGGRKSSWQGTLATAEVYDPATGTWSATGSMTETREQHEATLLPDGKVLVSGGSHGNDLKTAEVYDPATGTWSATGSMVKPRSGHKATLLPNGKVLVSGGIHDLIWNEEVYDPATGTWSITGTLAGYRNDHTATLLPNGKVLVSGGFYAGFPATEEVYDPATGTWSATDSMVTRRFGHAATLLPNGKVLVSGGRGLGVGGMGALATAEVYDPATGTWSATGSMTGPREQHEATLLPNGKVLVSGGIYAGFPATEEVYDPATGTWSAIRAMATPRSDHRATLLPNGKVLVSGGVDDAWIPLETAEVYTSSGAGGPEEPPPSVPDADENRPSGWAATASMASRRYGHTATLLPNGKVLVLGGHNNSSGTLATAEEYDPANRTWSATGRMASPRKDHTATLLPNGKVLVAGGRGISGVFATAEEYDPATGTWSATGSMASDRENHTATLLPDGKVLVSGGYVSGGPSATAEVYDSATGTWSATGSMASDRVNHTAMLLPNGKVLVSGGYANGYVATTEVYDPATGTWSATGSMVSSRANHTATLLPNGKVLVSGGYVSGPSATAEVYDPATGTWSATGSMVSSRAGHTATLLPNGKVLVSGGYGYGGAGPFPTAEVYDLATGTWSATDSMTSPRVNHTATLLPNGKVLVSGGSDLEQGTGSVIPLRKAEVYKP